jgi:hypothetical protein
MLEFSQKDLEIYKSNLIRRKKTFCVEAKRNEKYVKLNGKKVAKLKNNTSVKTLVREDSMKVLNLFASVKKSINSYLVKNQFDIEKIDKKYNSSFRNTHLFNSMPIGTEFVNVDVKHCYWRLAYLMGYISPYYYDKVLNQPDMKLWRNMALSCIIAPKKVEYYVKGESVHTITEDTRMYEQVYENIRFYAWNLFGRLCHEKIGKEKCLGYFTDGILIYPEDLPKVKTVLARHKLQYRVIKCEKSGVKSYVDKTNGNIINF